jgi:DNA-directed RNA polymerase specialized sigma24 family protein
VRQIHVGRVERALKLLVFGSELVGEGLDLIALFLGFVALRGGRRQRGRRVGVVPPAPEIDPIGTVLERAALEPLLARLPERQRIAIVLRYLADLPLVDVAAAMGCKVGTAKSTLHTALARLRVELSAADEELV